MKSLKVEKKINRVKKQQTFVKHDSKLCMQGKTIFQVRQSF